MDIGSAVAKLLKEIEDGAVTSETHLTDATEKVILTASKRSSKSNITYIKVERLNLAVGNAISMNDIFTTQLRNMRRK